MTEVPFPPLSAEQPEAEGVLASWFVDEGQHVDAGQTIAEVQVDKVSADVPAPVSGTVHLLVEEEAVVTQGRPIATID